MRYPDLEFGRRLTQAKHDWAARHSAGKLSNAEIGRSVGRLLRRPPYTAQTVGRWLRGRWPRSWPSVAKALAETLGCKPGWLVFGTDAPGESWLAFGEAEDARGVYRCSQTVCMMVGHLSTPAVSGQRAWYGIDSAGRLVWPGIRIAFGDESEADVVDAIRHQLDCVDPVRPALRLVPPDANRLGSPSSRRAHSEP